MHDVLVGTLFTEFVGSLINWSGQNVSQGISRDTMSDPHTCTVPLFINQFQAKIIPNSVGNVVR